MKQNRFSLIVLSSALVLGVSSLLLAREYILEINGTEHTVKAGVETEIQLSEGNTIKLKLTEPEFATYESTMVSFEHKTALSPAKSPVDPNITQILCSTPLGSGFLVQEYSSMNPSAFTLMMLQEITREEKTAGYNITESEVTKEVGGITLTGKRSISEGNGDRWVREAYGYGTDNKGFIIVTYYEENNNDPDLDMIELFWNSLKITL